MIRLLLILAMTGQVLLANASDFRDEGIRKGFIHAAQNKDARASYLSKMESLMSPSDPLLLAYTGASNALYAECALTPWSKYNAFKTGTTLIDKAIQMRPQDPELRYLRFLIQLKSPDFLGYKEAIDEDYDVISTYLKESTSDASWSSYFQLFVQQNDQLIDESINQPQSTL